jgi:glycerate 2-kinase
MAPKIIIAPGAFKHSLSANAAAEALARGLRRSGLDADLHLMPIADGGNGTLDVFLASGGQRIAVEVEGPLGEPVQAAYGLIDDGDTAVIEMALASGLELIDQPDALNASTYGTGQLLQAALNAGARRFIIGMGGSATVDGGAGCLQALGVHLLDASGQAVGRGGAALSALTTIDSSGLDGGWKDCEVIIASDVNNPTIGPQGAAAVFGPQKGASPDDVTILEANLRHFFTLVREQTGVDVLHTPGGGAAGALSAGLIAFLDGRIESGIDLVLRHSRFHEALSGAALVITGEGQVDAQTVHGKGPLGVAQLAAESGVPTIAIVGGLNIDDHTLHEAGIHAALPIITRPMPLDEAIRDAEDLVERAALRLGYILRLSVV